MRNYLSQSELTLNQNDLSRKSLNGGLQSLIGQIVSFIIMMSSTAILARLLTPEDYGLIAIAISITTFFTLFRDFGLSISLIQKQVLKNDEVDSIFWVIILIGCIITIILLLLAYPISAFFDDSRLINILIAVSSIFIIGSFSIIPNAILRRNMQFKKIMYIQILSSLIAAVSAIYLAKEGYGYWALVINVILPVLITTIATLYVLNWFPRASYIFKHIGNYIKFGKYIMSFDVVNYFSRNLDNILIGKTYSAVDLGYYSKSYQLLLLPIQQIRIPLVNVALPALSAVRGDSKMFNYYYIALSDILNVLTIPIVCLMWLNAHEIIFIVLGEQWNYSAEIFKLLAFAALTQPILGTFGLVLIALNNNKKYFKWGLLNFFIIITSFLIGINFDLEIFIILYVIANYVSFVVSIPYVFIDTPIVTKDFVRSFFIPILYFLPITYTIDVFINNSDINLFNLVIKTMIFLFFIIIFFLIVPGYRTKVLNIKKTFLTRRNDVVR